MSDVSIGIEIDPSGAAIGAGQVRRSLSEVDSAAGRTKGIFSELKTVAAGVFAGFTIGKVISDIADFGQKMAEVRALTDATDQQFKLLSSTAIQLGADTLFSASQAAEGMALLGQAGFDTQKIIEALPSVLSLATAGSITLGQAAENTSVILNTFALSADKSGKVADVLAAASAKSNASVLSLGEALSYAGPTAAALNIPLEDTAAAIGILSNAGIAGSRAGTNLNGILARLSDTSSEGAAALKALGLSVEDVNPSVKGLGGVIEALAAKGLDATSAFQIFGREAAPAILALTKNSAGLAKLTSDLGASGGAAKAMADIVGNTLKGKIDGLFGSLETLNLKLGEAGLTAIMKAVVQGLSALVNTASKFSGEILAAGFTLIAVAVGRGVASLAAYSYELVQNAAVTSANITQEAAHKVSLAATAAAALTAARNAELRAAAEVSSVRAVVASARAEIELERVRLGAQISEAGRIATINRMTQASLTLANAERLLLTTEIDLELAQTRGAVAATAASAAQARAAAAMTTTSLAARVAATSVNALNGAMALLGGPIGVAITVAAGLYFWLSKDKEAADQLAAAKGPDAAPLEDYRVKLAQLNGDLRETVRLQNAVEFGKANEAFKSLSTAVEAAESSVSAIMDKRNSGTVRNWVESNEQLAAANTELQRLVDQRRAALQYRDAVGGDGSAAPKKDENAAPTAKELAAAQRDASQAADEAADAYAREQQEIAQMREAMEQARATLDGYRAQYGLLNPALLQFEQLMDGATAALVAMGASGDDITEQTLVLAQAFTEQLAGGIDAATKAVREFEQKNAFLEIMLEKGVIPTQEAFDVLQGKIRQTLREATDGSSTAAGALQNDLGGALDGLSGSVSSIKSTLTDLSSEYGKMFAPLLTGLEAITSALGKQQDITEKLKAARIAAASTDVKVARDGAKSVSDLTKLQKDSAASQLQGYAQIAAGAAGFFGKQTAAHAAFTAAEKVFRAVEIGLALQNFATKSGLVAAFTGIHATGVATEIATEQASTVSTVASNAIKATSHGIVAFARTLASLPFPANVAAGAAVVGLLAAAGVAISGGGGGGGTSSSSAEVRQARQGTGTVLGDPSAKSESIGNALEQLVSLEQLGLRVNQQMLDSLRAIEAAFSGVTSQLYRANTGSGSNTPFNPAAVASTSYASLGTLRERSGPTGKITAALGLEGIDLAGAAVDALLRGFFGSTKIKQIDSGIQFAAAEFADILANGLSGTYYATLEKTKKKLFGLSRSTSTSDVTQALDDTIGNQFTAILENIGGAILGAVGQLGADVTEAEKRLMGATLNLGRISLQGLNAEDTQKAIENVFGAAADTLTATVLPAIGEFQQAGEGLFETLIRVGSQTSAVRELFGQLGIAFDLTFLDAARATENLIALAGGVDKLAENAASYYDAFFTDAEKLAVQGGYLRSQMVALGQTLPDTREGFRAIVSGLDLATESGQELFVALTGLAASADAYYTASQQAADAAKELADAAIELGRKLSSLVLQINADIADLRGQAAPLADLKDALAAVLQADGRDAQLDAADELRQAILSRYSAEVAQINRVRDARLGVLTAERAAASEALKAYNAQLATAKKLREFSASLDRSQFAPVTPQERLGNILEQFRSLQRAAQGGDAEAGQQLQSVGNELLTSARDVFASGDGFRAIFDEVKSSLGAVADAISTAPPEVRALEAIDAEIKAASATAAQQVSAAADRTVGALEALASYIQYGNARLEELVVGLAVLAGEGAAFADKRAGPLGGDFIPTFRGPQAVEMLAPMMAAQAEQQAAANAALVQEVQGLRQDVAAQQQTTTIRVVTPDGRVLREEVIREIRNRSRNGETIIYAQD